MTPENYDELLSLLLRAAEEARREAQDLVLRVFEDAASAAAHLAGELRQIAEYERTHETKLLTIDEAVALLYEAGVLEELIEESRKPECARPRELGLCVVCAAGFIPSESVVRVPGFDQVGFAHLDCLSVLIVAEDR